MKADEQLVNSEIELEALPESDDEEEWERVDVALNNDTSNNPELEITVTEKKRKRISKTMRIIRRLQHKTHLLCLLATCRIWNQYLNDKLLQAKFLSIIPSLVSDEIVYKDITSIKRKLKLLVKFWRELYLLDENIENFNVASVGSLIKYSDSKTLHPMIYSLLFITSCRALGFETRMSCALNPIPLSFRKANVENCCLRFMAEIIAAKDVLIVDPLSGLIETKVKKDFIKGISYVVAFDSKSNAKDVTRRYTSTWGNITRRRLPENSCESNWWDVTIWLLSKSNFTIEDDLEDQKLMNQEINQAMPTSFSAFKDQLISNNFSPLYVLERHLKLNEVIYPNDKNESVGIYKNELIFPRKNLQKVI